MSRTKWLLYTVLLGAAPIVTRLLVVFVLKAKLQWLSPLDVIGFGLALVLTNVNLLEYSRTAEAAWKAKHVGGSLLLALLLITAFALACANESAALIDQGNFLFVTILMALASVTLNYAVSDRLEKEDATR